MVIDNRHFADELADPPRACPDARLDWSLLGVVAASVAIGVLAVIGAVTVGFGIALWTRGLAL
jgi:hypothetical protein